jgi:hypothetical protein
MIQNIRWRVAMALLLTATLLLAGCEQVTPTPRPTRTRTIATETVEPTEAPTSAPTTAPTAAPQPTQRSAAAPAPAPAFPKPVVVDSLLPVFVPFPPKPIPSRDANINPLTGLTADPAMLRRRPIVARIGNDKQVRDNNWQAGLNQADIVFEELIDTSGAQYAATRFSAVYLSKDPAMIGPIRSERLINLQIVPMLDGALVSAGGSNGTRWLFSQSPVVNIDEAFNRPSYCYIERKSANGETSTYNYAGRLYTTAPRLREYMQSPASTWLSAYNGDELRSYMQRLGQEGAVPLYGFGFADQTPSGEPVNSIGFSKAPWPTAEATQWKYDPAGASYLRFSNGVAQIDDSIPVTAKWGSQADCVPNGTETKTQVRATNVVILYAKHEPTDIIEDSNNYVSVHITLTGQGNAQFFRDGVMVNGKWQRQSEQEFFNFVDASGHPYDLKPGNTFFEIVPTGYQPDLK